jgi:hypothetical protein
MSKYGHFMTKFVGLFGEERWLIFWVRFVDRHTHNMGPLTG